MAPIVAAAIIHKVSIFLGMMYSSTIILIKVGRSTAIGAMSNPIIETNQNFFLKGSVKLMTRLKMGSNGSLAFFDIWFSNKQGKLMVGE